MVDSKNKIIWKGSQLFVSADDVKDPVLTPHQHSMIQCQICMMILQEPQECEKCQNQFCLTCIKNWETSLKNNYKQSECPLRCKPLKYNKSHKFVRSLLDELKIGCPNLEKGCTEIVKIYDLENHQNLCSWEITKCSGFILCKFQDFRCRIPSHLEQCIFVMESCIHCKEKQQRREMVKHIEKACPEAPKTCEFCEKVFARKNLRLHRWNDCEMYPELCEFCSGTIPRKDMKKHLEICEMQPFRCELCGIKIKLVEAAVHINSECPEEIVLKCTKECKLSIKRKHLQGGNHECVKYLMMLLHKNKQKAKHLKAMAKHQHDVEKAFLDCERCKKSSKLAELTHRPIESLKLAFTNITSIFISGGLMKTESKCLSKQMDKHVVSILQRAYLNLESVAVESKYEEFNFIERRQHRQEEEEKKGEDQYVEADIFGFRMDDEDILKQFQQDRIPLRDDPRPAINLHQNQQQQYHSDYDDEDYPDLFGGGIFGDDY